jgi:SAM-dependent methyltransferase
MYQNIEDPWNQRESPEDVQDIIAITMMRHCLKVETPSVLDIGCGLGYMTSFIRNYTRAKFFVGIDVSKTAIQKAKEIHNGIWGSEVQFLVDDARKKNDSFVGCFDVVYCSKALYYMAPEIKDVIENINSYLISKGLFVFTYNVKQDSFSNRYITYDNLRLLLLKYFKELYFVEINRFGEETLVVGVYQK